MRKSLIMALAILAVAGAASAQPRPMGDRDRDGVPNVVDPHDNARDGGRHPMGDRDHDGRPNALDHHDDRWDRRWGREVRAPRHWGDRPGWNRHVGLCVARYHSYNPRTDTYRVQRRQVRCRL